MDSCLKHSVGAHALRKPGYLVARVAPYAAVCFHPAATHRRYAPIVIISCIEGEKIINRKHLNHGTHVRTRPFDDT